MMVPRMPPSRRALLLRAAAAVAAAAGGCCCTGIQAQRGIEHLLALGAEALLAQDIPGRRRSRPRSRFQRLLRIADAAQQAGAGGGSRQALHW